MATQIRTLSTAKVEPTTYIEYAHPALTILKGGVTETYTVVEIPTRWDGRAVQLIKPSGDWYDVFVCRRGQQNLCDCAGFTYAGRCKHQDAVRHLIHRGELGAKPVPTPDQDPAPTPVVEEETPF